MLIFDISIILVALYIAYRWPMAGISLAAQGYIVRNIFTNSPTNGSESLISVGLPATIFLLILVRSILTKRLPPIFWIFDSLVLFGIIYSLGFIYSPNHSLALDRIVRFWIAGASYYFIIIFAVYSSKTHIKNTNWAEQYFLGTWIIAIFVSVWAIFAPGGTAFRLSVGNVHPIPFGLLLATGLLYNIFLILRPEKSRIPRIILLASLPFILYSFIASNSRGPFVAFVAGLMYMVVALTLKKNNTKLSIGQLFALLIFLIILFVFATTTGNDITERLFNNLYTAIFETGSNRGTSAIERIDAWNFSIKMFSESPIIGKGTASFPYYHFLEYPHNIFLETAAELGTIGLLVMILWFGILIIPIVQIFFSKKNIDPTLVLVAAVLLANMLEVQVSFTIWMHKNLFIASALLLLSVRSLRYRSEIQKKLCQNEINDPPLSI